MSVFRSFLNQNKSVIRGGEDWEVEGNSMGKEHSSRPFSRE